MKQYFFCLLALLWIGCSESDPLPKNTPNILLIIADDMGKDATNGFSEGNVKPSTPHIDALKNEGLIFSNFWVYPTCTPTRASIITGKYGYRTGVKSVGDELSTSELVVQEYINQETDNAYATAVVGKWHLSGDNLTADVESFGIDYYNGYIRGGVQDYYRWRRTEDGSSSLEESYITEAFTDIAIEWKNNQEKPWFLWLAYTAPHTPFHAPPQEMHSQGNLETFEEGLDPLPYYLAAIEAMDYQIGRFLDAMSTDEKENTIIIFMGDNGTPGQVAQSPYSSTTSKGSLYQGGINVPLFISGFGVNRQGVDNNLLTGTDLYCTMGQIAGSEKTVREDSKSFYHLLSSESNHRSYQYCEMVEGNGDIWTISNGRYKLFVSTSGEEELYNLQDDPYETINLLNGSLTVNEEAAKTELNEALKEIRN